MDSAVESLKEDRENLRQKTIAGIGWSAIAQIIKQVFQLVISVILARLLMPHDFGIMGMIMVFSGFVGLFSEMGFSTALIQREKIEERHYSSVFWINILTGLILTCLFVALAPLIAVFFKETSLTPLAMLVSVNFTISSFATVQRAIIERVMNFRLLAFVEVAIVIVSGVVAILLAMSGYGVWSLVWQMLVASSLTSLIMWCASSWRPRLLFELSAISELFRYSINLLGFNTWNYWLRNLDNVLIGKFFGTFSLGIYERAYMTMMLPLTQIGMVVSRVMIPALSKIQNDKYRVKSVYLQSIAMIALVTFPMMMGLFVVSDHFVLAIFGSKWEATIPILKILSLLGMVQSIQTTVGWIYVSQGRTDWMFKWGLAAGILIIGSFVVGIWIGTMEAVAASYAITGGIILLYPTFAIPGKLIGMTFTDVVRRIVGIIGCVVFMGAAVWGIDLILPSIWPHWLSLSVQVPFGIIVYILLIHFFKVRAYFEIRKLFEEQWQKRFTASVATS